jgi:hypothetical protein
MHSEINTINIYYKKKLNKNIIKSKKILFIFKLSKTGILGNSRPCLSCSRFLYNNYDNLNLINVYFSTKEYTLEKLNKEDLINKKFELSSGFKKNKF